MLRFGHGQKKIAKTSEINLTQKYSPHCAQLPFHLDGYKVKYRGVFGGTGSGKTLAGVAEDVRWVLENPGVVGYVFEPTYTMVKRILIPTLEKFFGSLGLCPLVESFHQGDLHIKFRNSSQLWLGSLDEPEMAEGANVDFVHVDEARLVRYFEKAWRVIERRLRGSGGGFPIGAWITTTPDYPGSVLHRLFEDSKTKLEESRVYRFPLAANQENLPAGYIEAVKRAHTGCLYSRFVDGFFATTEGLTFNFDYSLHVQGYREPLSRDRRVEYGVDFGWTNPTAIVVVLFDNDGRAFVSEEIYKSRLSDNDLINLCQELQEIWGEGTFHCDPSEPRTIETMNNSGLRANPSKHKRDEGIREIGGRLKVSGDGFYRLYISKSCTNLIDEMQSYDANRKMHDHAVDALRYCLVEGKQITREWPSYLG